MFYVDTSALVKLVVAEEFSPELRRWTEAHGSQLVSSDLTRTELMRAVHRVSLSLMPAAVSTLDTLALITPTTATFSSAGRLLPVGLRSLDALHIATALDFGDEIDGFVAYDHRLLSAAETNGLPVITPGETS